MSPFKHILVPTDFGEPSQRALEIALELPGTLGADLRPGNASAHFG